MIAVKREELQRAVQSNAISKHAPEVQMWHRILTQHIRLAHELELHNAFKIVQVAVKDKFYPLEKILEICKEFNQTESCALLSKKIGNYHDSVTLYFKILEAGLDIRRFRKELFYLHDR